MAHGARTSWQDRLGGLTISEERRLAGQAAGALYLVGAATALTMLALPHVERGHWPVVVAIALAGGIWGVACLTVVPWERARPLVSHLSSFAGSSLDEQTPAAILDDYGQARVEGIRTALSLLAVFAVIALYFTRRIPETPPGSQPAVAG